MRKYELLIILPGTLDDKGAEEMVKDVVGIIKDYSQEPEVNKLGKIRLAYPIKQIRYGYFYSLVFETETKNVPEINDKLRLKQNLLRAIINIYDPKVKDKQRLFIVSQSTVKTDVKEKMSLADVMEDKKDEAKVKQGTTAAELAADLKDIDKRLDEILDSANIIADV